MFKWSNPSSKERKRNSPSCVYQKILNLVISGRCKEDSIASERITPMQNHCSVHWRFWFMMFFVWSLSWLLQGPSCSSMRHFSYLKELTLGNTGALICPCLFYQLIDQKCGGKVSVVEILMNSLLSRLVDSSHVVRKFCIRGLGNISSVEDSQVT